MLMFVDEFMSFYEVWWRWWRRGKEWRRWSFLLIFGFCPSVKFVF